MHGFLASAEQFELMVNHLSEESAKMQQMKSKLGKAYKHYYDTCYIFKKMVSKMLQEVAMNVDATRESVEYHKSFYIKAKMMLEALGYDTNCLSYLKNKDFELN